jgi:hypothetical protein
VPVTVQTGNGGVLQQSMSLGLFLVVENCTFRGQEISIQKLISRFWLKGLVSNLRKQPIYGRYIELTERPVSS